MYERAGNLGNLNKTYRTNFLTILRSHHIRFSSIASVFSEEKMLEMLADDILTEESRRHCYIINCTPCAFDSGGFIRYKTHQTRNMRIIDIHIAK